MIAIVAVKNKSLDKKAIQAGKTKSSEAKRRTQPQSLIPPRHLSGLCWFKGRSEEIVEIFSSKSTISVNSGSVLLITKVFYGQNPGKIQPKGPKKATLPITNHLQNSQKQ
jgi:hypothetical protein